MSQAKYVIYTKDGCSFCEKSKRLLRSKSIGYDEIDLAYQTQAQIKELIAKTGVRTLPQIFVDGQYVGGFAELQQMMIEGKLDN